MVWDNIKSDPHAIPCLSSIWIIWPRSRGGGGWRAWKGVWDNRNASNVLSTSFVVWLHFSVAFFWIASLKYYWLGGPQTEEQR